MARAMEATFARRWQDTALNLIGDAKNAARANLDARAAFSLPTGSPLVKVEASGPFDNVAVRSVSVPIAHNTNHSHPASARCFLRERAGPADDSQLIHALFPEVVASVSAEQKAKPVQKGPLGLSLNHSDVFRAWETRSNQTSKPPISPTSADTIFEALHIKPAKAALEASCGPLPRYCFSEASIKGTRVPSLLLPRPQPDLFPVSAMSGTVPASIGPILVQTYMSPAGSINTVSGHGSCSTGSLSCCSSPVSRNTTPESIEPLDSILDGVPMEVDAPCLDSSVGCLKADLEELAASLAASLGPCNHSGSGDFGTFLSDSDDASDGTHFSGGHLWGGPDDAYDSIFGSADADASMASDSCHTNHAEDDVMPFHFSAEDRRLRSGRHGRGGFPAAATFATDLKLRHISAPSACSTDMYSAGSTGSPLGPSYHDFSQDSSTGSGALLPAVLPAIPLYEALMPLHVGQFFPDASLASLPQSLVAIPAKTAECAKSARAACAAKCKEKRQNRHPAKICYEMRKIDAEKRPRFKGRFVKRADLIAQEVFQHCEVTSTAISDDLATCFTYPTDPFPFLDEICYL